MVGLDRTKSIGILRGLFGNRSGEVDPPVAGMPAATESISQFMTPIYELCFKTRGFYDYRFLISSELLWGDDAHFCPKVTFLLKPYTFMTTISKCF